FPTRRSSDLNRQIDETSHIGSAAFDIRNVRPIELRTDFHVAFAAGEIRFDHFGFRGRGAELSDTRLDEWITQCDVLCPSHGPVERGKILHFFSDADASRWDEGNLPGKAQLRLW